MKQIQIVMYCEDFITGELERDVEIGYLIAPGIAVLKCVTNTIYFVNVSPSDEGGNLYDHVRGITDIAIMNSADVDIKSMPAEAVSFAVWAAGYEAERRASGLLAGAVRRHRCRACRLAGYVSRLQP